MIAFSVGVEDHGCPYMFGTFNCEDGTCQGFGYFIDMAFVMRFLSAVGVCDTSEVKGKSVWITRTNSNIVKVEPLHKKDGTPFVIKEWQEWIKSKGPSPTPSEMLTGVDPRNSTSRMR